MSAKEQLLILSITGGVPKYLEELHPKQSASQNVMRLCFEKGGFLFNEYDRIFSDIFEKRAKSYEKIIKLCLEKKHSPTSLAKALGTTVNSDLSEQLHVLELSGFVSRDYYFHPTGEQSKLGHIRVKDNYLRFYLKQILPLKNKIESGAKQIQSLKDLKNIDSILGFQFENLLLANRPVVHFALNIEPPEIISSSPYVQRKTTKTKGACQVDLWIHTTLDVFYLCEFKCKNSLDKSIITEVKKKMSVLALPKRAAVKPVLIYQGELYEPHRSEIEAYFFRILSFEDIIRASH